MKATKLKKGARLMARWPNTQYYYWSTLIEQAGDEWKIQFDDGTISLVTQSDLHESLPADARNRAGRVTRSSPTKNRKRPEEIRKSPARKVRKLFTEEENARLGAELSDVKEKGATDVRPSSRERSISVSKETEDMKHSPTDVRSSSRERSVSVSKETEDETHSVRPSSRERSVSVSRERADVTHNASDVRSSPFKRSVSITRETEDVTKHPGDVRQSPSRASIRVTIQNDNVKGVAADARPSPSKGSYDVEIQKETVTRNVTRYMETYLDTDLRRRVLKESSIGSADLCSSPIRKSDNLLDEIEKVTQDVRRYTESYLDQDFRSRLLKKEGSVGSTDVRSSPVRGLDSLLSERGKVTGGSTDVRSSPVRGLDSLLSERGKVTGGPTVVRSSPVRGLDSLLNERGKVTGGSTDVRSSPVRGLDSLLNERGKVTGDLKKYTESFLDRDFRTKLGREGSVGSSNIHSSPYRRSVSVTKENTNLTGGTTLTTKYSLKDYEKKYMKKYTMEFGGRFGTLLLILLLPLYIMSVSLFDLVPDTTKFEVSYPKRLLLIPQVAVGVIMVLLVQAVLTTVPIGTVASGPLTKLGILNMRCNGMFAALLTLILTSSACYFERDVAAIVVDVYSEAAVSAMLLGIIFALILYRRAAKLPISYLNPYGCTGFKLYDFWMGQEVTPCIGKFNIKLVLHRFSLIVAVALNVQIVTKAYFQGADEDLLKSLMISTVLQSLYCFHFLYHEDIYLYSFLAISEGVGYMITVGFMSFPFIVTFTTKVILDYRLKASLTELYIALFAYTVGHLLLESSSNKKTLSVRDPITSVWKMKVLPKWSPSVHTKAYFGEIIIYWAFAMVAGTTYLGLFIIPAAFTFSVLSRAFREYTRSAAYQGEEVNTKQ